jgi:hypothetical protein
MKKYKIIVKEIILSNDKKPFGCETFSYEPSNIEEEPLGNLYIMGLIKGQKKEMEFLPNLVASIARREFYKLTDTNPETSFENCLKKVNAAILDLQKEHKNLRKHISFCVINITKNILRFSQLGGHFIYMLRNDSLMNIGGREKESKNLFSAVVSGDLELNDSFIFATSQLNDIFSKKSIGKILSYDIEKQADVIHKLYDEESKEIPMPPQAALLFKISTTLSKKTLKSVFGMTKKLNDEKIAKLNQKEKLKEKKKAVHSFTSPIIKFIKERKGFIASLLTLILLATITSFYVKIKTASDLINNVNTQIIEAKEKAPENKQEALNTLNGAKKLALSIYSYPFFSDEVKSLEKKIEIATNEINGIFNIIKLKKYGKITGKAFDFDPKFIFENEGTIYVFGNQLNSFYKIKNNDSSGSFLFLDNNDSTFEVERAFKDQYGIYFINYINEEVYRFTPETEKLEKITDKKAKRQLLRLKPSQYIKEYNGIKYSVDKNQIVKTKDDEKKELNFLTLIRIKDYSVSGDEKYIYILSEREVFRSENK